MLIATGHLCLSQRLRAASIYTSCRSVTMAIIEKGCHRLANKSTQSWTCETCEEWGLRSPFVCILILFPSVSRCSDDMIWRCGNGVSHWVTRRLCGSKWRQLVGRLLLVIIIMLRRNKWLRIKNKYANKIWGLNWYLLIGFCHIQSEWVGWWL